MATSPTLDVLSPTNSHFLLTPEHEETEHSEDHLDVDFDRSDGDTASQRSISLSSPPMSPRQPMHLDPSFNAGDEHVDESHTSVTMVRESLNLGRRDSHPLTLDTDFGSEQDAEGDDRSSFMRRLNGIETPLSSAAPSIHEEDHELEEKLAQLKAHTKEKEVEEEVEEGFRQQAVSPPPSSRMSYPPPPLQKPDASRESVSSFASGSTSYSKKARPESMLVTHQGPLVLGIALVDFNHLVCLFISTHTISLHVSSGWSKN